ncbi:PrsW family intramembrane metalloprotease [Streptococcus dysgalactiae]|uniref:PrsW family intramembrane metalloprotease n=1 Tax=Streptococcus dysgalactiae TaxID=1334 RepID=UPI0010CACD79|nr:PrsW family glutamic-type intramembrane protease [Streptococcus dysgalactiae]MDY2964304.1 PrsW family glutamic-type intramembrane protease [Streptococcus dysgalactiae]MDY4035036.1 PrsW family glutamic-type intramembrane protease [Streptococcus dysgalactiae]MEC4578698.1 PrsW family glutamic-type intramembrane protease [Streptococcus dysgalactiae]QZT27079.1 PrsW family intramembrane metalloprotease [Streptococcus dysgalactiae]VTT09188.1 membrane protein [Streptococcus dysgalactiae]
MKTFLQIHKQKLGILIALILGFHGALLHFQSFGKPENHLEKYPLFFGTILLISIYAIPLIAFIRYLVKRFKVSSQVVVLSWLAGIFVATSLSINFHILIGYTLRTIFNPSEAFIGFWGAAVSAPFAEEFGKGLAALLVLFICRKFDVKTALVSGMIVGLGFQIMEDCVYTFQEIFVSGKSPFPMLIERIVWASCTHWLFTALFVSGFVIVFNKVSGFSRNMGLFWMFGSMFVHFLFNIPMNSEIYDVATATLSMSLYLLLLDSIIKQPINKLN